MTTNRESTDDKQETTHNYDMYTHTRPYRSVHYDIKVKA